MDNGNRLIGIDGKKPMILVVDDTPSNLVVISTIVEDEGGEVRVARNGPTALRLAQLSPRPDLILLDIMMPDMDGHMVLAELRKNPLTRNIPVIFVTASDDKHDIVAGFHAGAQDYIIKPSTKEELLARVKTHLALCKTQQSLKLSREKYRELSFLDDLTGLYNTRYLYQRLEEQLDQHQDQAVTVVFIDIDKFKAVVDTHGHLNGSRTIAELAAIIKAQLPQGSFGVSYGGDEFVLVLADCDTTLGRAIAEKIRMAIAENLFLTTQGLALQLTVSSGLATYPQDATTLIDLLGNADHALFETKKRGRNGVVSYGELKAEEASESKKHG